jgi:hypothetical protein
MLMPVVIGRRLAGRVIGSPDGQADKQNLINPYDHPAVEEGKNQASANDCRGSEHDHNSYQSGKIHIKLLYSFLHTLSLMMLVMPMPALLTDYVEESTNTTVVEDDNES